MLENAVFWGAGCAIVWGFSDYIARLAGRSVGAMVATLAMMSVGAVLVAVIMIVMAEPLDWRLDGLHWLLAIGLRRPWSPAIQPWPCLYLSCVVLGRGW